MYHDCNVIGRVVSQLRYQRGWTQDQLVARLQVMGCSITRNVLANIETRRSIATDKQIAFLARAFGVEIGTLFPPLIPESTGAPVGVSTPEATRRRTDIGTFPSPTSR